MRPALAVIDYDAGNLRSLSKALQLVGAQVTLARSPREAGKVDAVVLPGDGAFGPAMSRLNAVGFPEWIRTRVAAGIPLLGVCLGMQLLFEGSEEAPGVQGLGLVAGQVRRLPAGVKVPHMGWNQVMIRRPSGIIADMSDGAFVYFVHSYAVDPADPADVIATTTYGTEFPAIVRRGGSVGVQFHPEKSGAVGLRLLRSLISWVGKTPVVGRVGD